MKKYILLMILMLSCKKEEQLPKNNIINNNSNNYTYSHYLVTGYKTLAIHFGNDSTSLVYPFIGDNEIYLNDSLVSNFTLRTDTVGNKIYYAGIKNNILHQYDTIRVIDNKINPHIRIYKNSILVIDTLSNNATYILN